jgi:putative tryptophan/tyrosine transport system substrate-binding protein
MRRGEAKGAAMIRQAIALIATLAMALLAAPLAAEAQPPSHVPRVGFLDPGQPEVGTAFRQGLQALGYVEGQNIIMEWRSWEGRPARAPELIAELVHLKVDVLVVPGSRLVREAQQATTAIPIVMVAGGDPVGQGFVANLARPGGNITGLTVQHPELHGKTLELVKETLPQLSRAALLWETNVDLSGRRDIEDAARSLGVQLQILEARSPEECPHLFQTAVEGHAEALYVSETAMLGAHLPQIADLAVKSQLPAIGQTRPSAEAGLLLPYGPDVPDLFRRAATYVDKILKGAKPGDLPVERPMKLELVLNLRTAKALGLTMPPSLLFQADEVIR